MTQKTKISSHNVGDYIYYTLPAKTKAGRYFDKLIAVSKKGLYTWIVGRGKVSKEKITTTSDLVYNS